MTTILNWFDGLAGVLAAAGVRCRWARAALGTALRARGQRLKLRKAARPAGNSRYGAWLTETVTYHH